MYCIYVFLHKNFLFVKIYDLYLATFHAQATVIYERISKQSFAISIVDKYRLFLHIDFFLGFDVAANIRLLVEIGFQILLYYKVK